MTITIVGHGYVGLITACVFADFGNKVWVIGHTKEKINQLKKGNSLIYEPGLKELLQKNLKEKKIFFTLSYDQAVKESEIVFITVGTPSKENGEANLSNVYDVVRNIAKFLKKDLTVVACKSTVPVGTNLKIETIIKKHKNKEAKFCVASVPEFLREGTAINDTINPDRVVIGSNSKKAIEVLLKLHQPLGGEKIVTNLTSAELIKYAANCLLATKVSFANLISFYCQKTGANVEKVLTAVGLDKRLGRNFLFPGVGYGGSCLPKDVKAMINVGDNLKVNTNFLKTVEEINLEAKNSFLKTIFQYAPGKNLAIWGLSFKPETDDIRDAPSLYIIQKLIDNGFSLNVYDLVAQNNIKRIFKEMINYVRTPYEAVKKADGLVILTEWNEFKEIDLKKVKKLMKQRHVFDGRNIYEPEAMRKLGFKYFSIGRPFSKL